MYPYAIGLDIGVTSVGWAALALDEDDRPYGIINMGARIFDAAENPKNGDSLAAPRREKRSMRRRLRRHRHRNERIRALMVDAGILTRGELEHLFEGKLPDIYALRVKALDEAVTPQEFARILLHISQRRGFRSNRKNPTDKEDGALLGAVSANKALMAEKGYRTVGEMLLLDPAYAECKRNKGGSYIATVGRDMTEDEVRRIFAAQRELGAAFASEDIEERYLAILLSQRSFDAGPGEGSPYAGNQIERMIGGCTFEPGEQRAAKATYSFEYFTLLQNVNHLRLVTGGESAPLTEEQRRLLIELAHKTKDPSFTRIRKELAVPDGTTFNAVSYPRDASVEEAEKKAKFKGLAAYHEMKTAFNKLSKNHIDDISVAQRNEIGRVLSIFKTSDKIRPLLKDAGLSEEEIDAAETLSFSKFGHISVKACEKLIPYLEQGMNYNDACAAAGYDFKAHGGEKTRLLHPTEDDFADVTSPVVRRAVSQTVKVLNAMIRERGGSPTYINIELARELAKDFSERNKLKRDMDARGAENERIMELIRSEYGHANPTGQDLVKYRLWCEQHEECAYSQKHISIERLFEPNYVEVDHIIPYSISFDDSYKNKVLVFAKENRDKGNRLPLEYLTGQRRDDFIVWVENNVRDFRKRQKLLKEKLTEDDQKSFKERALQDTKHMSAFLMNYIRDNLEFADFVSGRKKHVTAVNGVVTSYMRKRWGIEKIRENGDLHHAVDAVVVGCTTDGMIQEVSRYAEYRECEYMQTDEGAVAVSPATGEVLRKFPYPWPRFRAELEARLGADPARAVMEQGFPVYLNEDIKVRPLFVSRMPRRKVTGEAHLETIKSAKALGEGVVIVKKSLTKLELDKDGEIADYYNPVSDRLLYEALKARLHRFGGDAAKAFAEPFRKPKADGTPGPIVKKVKIREKASITVPVLQGNGVSTKPKMVRIDVFYAEGDGYYFVPIYIPDTMGDKLPDKACVKGKPKSEWKEMRPEDFVFSLYHNDLILIQREKEIVLSAAQKDSTLAATKKINKEMVYYTGADIDSGRISFETHDASYGGRVTIKSLEKLEKYTFDVLGEYHKVEKEPRMSFGGRKR